MMADDADIVRKDARGQPEPAIPAGGRQHSPSVPILMYHQVAARPLPAFRAYTITPRMFAAHMKWLAWAGYTPITLDALLHYRRGHSSLPLRPVVLTFDDGFQECVDHVVPILKRHGFTAMFYLVAGLMGNSSRWMLAEPGVNLPLIDWATARQLETEGFRCGSHTMSHPHLPELSPSEQRHELTMSRCLLEDHLGHEIAHMAYPYGSFDEHVRAMVAEAGYSSACSAETGLSHVDDDPLALRRVPIDGQDTLLDFVCRLRTARTCREYFRRRTGDVRCRLMAMVPRGRAR